MPCDPKVGELPDGTKFSFIACSRGNGRRFKKCSYCSRPHTKLCDFVVGFKTLLMTAPPKPGEPMTCDKPVCDACADTVGPDKDHCRIHRIRGDKEAA